MHLQKTEDTYHKIKIKTKNKLYAKIFAKI